jgi:hypothetical protein
MNLKSSVAAGIVVIVTISAIARWPERAVAQPAAKGTWEYKFVSGESATEATANQLGAEGWELVAVAPPNAVHTGAYTYYFKRTR